MNRIATATVGTALVAGVVLAPTAAFAKTTITSDYCGDVTTASKTTTCTEATSVTRGTTKTAHTPTKLAISTAQASTLPFTGGDIAGMTAAGIIVLGAGTGLTLAGRRRHSA